MDTYWPCFSVQVHTCGCLCTWISNLTLVNRREAWIYWAGCIMKLRVPECFSIQNKNTWSAVCTPVSLSQQVSGWHRTLALSASRLFKILLLNHLKMMWQVLKWSTLAPSTKTKKHQTPFRSPTPGNDSEAVGAGKSLGARGEELESIRAFCPRSEAFYCAGPPLIITIMWPQCIAYIKANAINLYMSGTEKAPFKLLEDDILYSTHRLY